MRYRHLLQKELDTITLRELSRRTGIGVASLHVYMTSDVEPRLEILRKMSRYFNEPVGLLIDDDDDLTAELIKRIRSLPPQQKNQILESIENDNSIFGPYGNNHKQKGSTPSGANPLT